jgi:hypothetical protein
VGPGLWPGPSLSDPCPTRLLLLDGNQRGLAGVYLVVDLSQVVGGGPDLRFESLQTRRLPADQGLLIFDLPHGPAEFRSLLSDLGLLGFYSFNQ